MSASEALLLPAQDDALVAEVVLPGDEAWEEYIEFETEKWSERYELTPDQHRGMYFPFNERSVLNGVRRGGGLVGMTRIGLPYADATTFADAGMFTVHDVLEGNPVWGKLDISPQGWDRLGQFDPRLSVDVLTHLSDDPSDRKVAEMLESLTFGIAEAKKQCYDQGEVDSDKWAEGSVVVTDLVRLYRKLMSSRYNYVPKNDDEPILTVEALGKEVPYGEGDPNYWATVVAMAVNKAVAADRLKHDPPKIDLELFTRAAPDFPERYAELPGLKRT